MLRRPDCCLRDSPKFRRCRVEGEILVRLDLPPRVLGLTQTVQEDPVRAPCPRFLLGGHHVSAFCLFFVYPSPHFLDDLSTKWGAISPPPSPPWGSRRFFPWSGVRVLPPSRPSFSLLSPRLTLCQLPALLWWFSDLNDPPGTLRAPLSSAIREQRTDRHALSLRQLLASMHLERFLPLSDP